MRLDRVLRHPLCDAAPLFENLNEINKQFLLTGNLFLFSRLHTLRTNHSFRKRSNSIPWNSLRTLAQNIGGGTLSKSDHHALA